MKRLSVLFVVIALLSISAPVHAQQEIQCGEIIQDQFTTNNEFRQFSIKANVGDAFALTAKAAGSTLLFAIFIQDPVGNTIFKTDSASNTPMLTTDTLGAPGTYFVTLFNGHDMNSSQLGNGNSADEGYYPGGKGIGQYTLNVGCTLANGKVVKAGDLANTNVTGNSSTATASAPVFSGTGFPGLAPVDFSNAITVSLGSAGSNGTMPPANDTVLGYTLTGNANNSADLSFKRVSGNLNLGLVVLAPNNKVVFQASLVNTSSLDVQFTLPVGGTYTIGIFRIDLIPPDKPTATSFQLQINLS